MRRKVMRTPARAGCAVRAPEQPVQVQPLAMGVYACGVYMANERAVLGDM
jgi:hypothetical protein